MPIKAGLCHLNRMEAWESIKIILPTYEATLNQINMCYELRPNSGPAPAYTLLHFIAIEYRT